MNDEAALLKAIAREPREDSHRLVYADWLDEHGDPARAELIRLQCAIQRGLDWETGERIADDRRLSELRSREHELKKALLRTPAPGERPALRELHSCNAGTVEDISSRVTFRRGMIRDFYLHNTGVTSLPPGLYVGGLLDLSNSSITSLPPDLLVGAALNLRGTHIKKLPPRLRVGGNLYLDNTGVTSLPPGLYVGYDLFLTNTPITSLPQDLRVDGNLYLYGVSLRESAARKILTMPGLSDSARITGLESAGFRALGQEARRQARRDEGPAAPPRL